MNEPENSNPIPHMHTELTAMADVLNILTPLDKEAQKRVLAWVGAKLKEIKP